jgi:phosphoglycolate phosphatase-like HAD superfamily hydrolase
VKLVLFDIDGTLVHSGGQAKPVFAEAMLEVFGTTGAIEAYDFSGRTDARIVVDLAVGAGVPEAEAHAGLERVRELYLARFERAFDPRRARVLPGVEALLDDLAARGDVALGLLTGNWRGGAAIKLGALGLFDRFAFGSFADDALDRRELPPIALERARLHTGRAIAAAETVIVGDSPLDVDCALAHGIPCLAVATGWTGRATLEAEGATWVLDDLTAALDHAAFALGAGAPEPAR